MRMARPVALAVAVGASALALLSGTSRASAPPVGPLPAGHTASIRTDAGQPFAVALPHSTSGKTWRIARPFDSKVIRQLSEADVGANVVVIFRGLAKGTTRLSFGLTLGERTKAYDSRVFTITVR